MGTPESCGWHGDRRSRLPKRNTSQQQTRQNPSNHPNFSYFAAYENALRGLALDTIGYVKDRAEIKPLTGLRGFAALYVFLFHMDRWPYIHRGFVSNIIDQGAIGMTIFFVLSGFVLAYQYSAKPVSFRTYAVNRFARIYPIYFLCMVLSVGTLHRLADWSVAGSIARLSTLTIANIFVIQAWFPPFFDLWNDPGSWSISVEAFCYLLLPFILAALTAKTRKQFLLIACCAYVFGLLPGAVFHLWDRSQFALYYTMPIFRLPQFLLGVCACLVLRLDNAPRVNTWSWTMLIAGTAIYIGLQGQRYDGFITLDWLIIPAVAITVYYLGSARSIATWLLSTRPIVWFGHVSYCFYSFQVLLILFLLAYHAQLVVTARWLGHDKVLLTSSFIALTTASAIGHHWIEEPLRRRIRRNWDRP